MVRHCGICRKPDHDRRICPVRPYRANPNTYQKRHCSFCGKPGHNRTSCPTRFATVKKCLGERLVDGEIHQVLECGHTVAATLDIDGFWVQERRQCYECTSGVLPCKPLYEGEPTFDFRRKAWQKLRNISERSARGSVVNARVKL